MQMRRSTTCLFILLFVFGFCKAQELRVTDFYMDQSDLTANQSGTMVFDQNGEKCALIKIITTGTDFRFDVGSLGVKKVEQKIGEIWLYVPYGIKKIKLNHQKFGYCEYPVNVGIEKARTYVMKLFTKAVSEGGAENFGQITVNSDPEGAEVYLDGINVGFTPYYFEYAIPGTHKVSIRKVGFYYSESEVEIKKGENKIINEKMVKSCDIVRRSNRIDLKIKESMLSLIKVEGGSYIMGATPEQTKPNSDESPSHQVVLSNYYIGETEVTNDFWEAIMGSNPSLSNGTAYSTSQESDMPITDVSWNDCQKFISRLNSLTGLSFSLPTEAQWEFAARGGNLSKKNIYAGGNNPKDIAWYAKNSDDRVNRVKCKRPNELGIYDMSGNVWEWCEDWYAPYSGDKSINPHGPQTGRLKVIRGGCVANKDKFIRITTRNCEAPDSKASALGFRLVLVE